MTAEPPPTVFWCEGLPCCDPLWEQAYRDFETPQEELQKFLRRYRRLGAQQWPRDWEVVELFCGTGNCLKALTQMGFEHVEGVDLSPDLLAEYEGSVPTYVGDCRDLKFADASKDVVIIQGGLHHLPEFPQDVESVLQEVHRVLRPGGLLVLVEPWLTPFLRIVHLACSLRPLRRVWSKLDAVARMNEQEWPTYNRWLTRPREVLEPLDRHFLRKLRKMERGKLMFVGSKPTVANCPSPPAAERA